MEIYSHGLEDLILLGYQYYTTYHKPMVFFVEIRNSILKFICSLKGI